MLRLRPDLIMDLKGTSIIGFGRGRETADTFTAFSPATAEPIEPKFHSATITSLAGLQNSLMMRALNSAIYRAASEQNSFERSPIISRAWATLLLSVHRLRL